MEKRTVGIVATVITVLLCGCPGLGALCWGLVAALAGVMPNSNIDIGGSHEPTTAIVTGLATCCGGIIFIAIPIAVGFFTLRKKAADGIAPVSEQPPSPM